MGPSMQLAKQCMDSKTSFYHVVRMSWLDQDAGILQSELARSRVLLRPYR